MKNIIFSVFLVALVTISVSGNQNLRQALTNLHYPNCSWEQAEAAFHNGRKFGFYTIEEVLEFFNYLAKVAPKMVTFTHKSEQETLGRKKNHVFAYAITADAHLDQLELENKPGILFTASHRADEPITTSQTMYIALNWIHKYHQKDSGIQHFLNQTVAWLVPIVNPDGYQYFMDKWKETNKPPPIHKNRFKAKYSKCNDNNLGVDLNRNYGYNWIDRENSTDCDQDYPGIHQFSEIETNFVSQTVYTHPDLKLAVNFMGAHGLWRMPHNITHLHHGYDLYHQVKNDTHIDINDTYTGQHGDVTDWMYFNRNITAFSGMLGIEGENGQLEASPKRDKAMEMYRKTLTTVNTLYAMLPARLEHDFTVWEHDPPHYIPETAVNASKYRMTLIVQAFNKGFAPKHNTHIGIQLNNGIHQNAQHSMPFHMHYEIVTEDQITKANDRGNDYKINGKFTSGEIQQHNVQPITTHWNKTAYHGHENVTLYSNEAITIPGRSFIRVYVLVHRKVSKNANFDVLITSRDDDPYYVLEHVTWSHPEDGFHAGSIFLIIMTIFLLIFVPLCVCFIYTKQTQEENFGPGLGGDYMMMYGKDKDKSGVEMLGSNL